MGCASSAPVTVYHTSSQDLADVPTHLLIRWSEIEIDEQIALGGFGEVFTGRWQGNRVAVKIMRPEQSEERKTIRKNLIKEVVIMSKCNHPSVARVFGMIDEPDRLGMVMTYYRKGSLFDFMTKPESKLQYQELDVLVRLSLALQVAKGMAFLHERDILHGDLKTSNVLLESLDTRRVYLTDFGLARELNNMKDKGTYGENSPESSMSVHISPPEVLEYPRAPRGTAVDIYAFAIVLLEIMTGAPAYRMAGQMIAQVVKQGRRPSVPDDVPASVGEVIKQCWAQDPYARPSAQHVVATLDQALRQLAKEKGDPDLTFTYLASPRG